MRTPKSRAGALVVKALVLHTAGGQRGVDQLSIDVHLRKKESITGVAPLGGVWQCQPAGGMFDYNIQGPIARQRAKYCDDVA
jgi:hypothetical protein